jgi:hypothetical protein
MSEQALKCSRIGLSTDTSVRLSTIRIFVLDLFSEKAGQVKKSILRSVGNLKFQVAISMTAEPVGHTVMTQEQRPNRVLMALLYLFTFVTGLVDAVSFIGLGHVFTANMTGNVVFLGFAAAGTRGLSVWRSLAALATFLIGASIGGCVSASRAPISIHRWTPATFGSEALLPLGANWLQSAIAHHPPIQPACTQ